MTTTTNSRRRFARRDDLGLHFSPLSFSPSSSSKKKSFLREVTNTHSNTANTPNEEEKEETLKNNGQKKTSSSSSLELKYRATVAVLQTHANAFEQLAAAALRAIAEHARRALPRSAALVGRSAPAAAAAALSSFLCSRRTHRP